ncbi:MAG: ImmA/IrrE family metallo-endopeptidase [Clostridiales bacterium]|nr:ImmA/IrrE family metallo-endopeptidase [Clostridiales bacterium]
MIPLYFETKPGGVPLLSDRDIERDAAALIRDFNPSLLSDPVPVDIERFAESYLQLSIDFNWLSHNQTLLGRMVFCDTIIPVYDPYTKRAEDFPVHAHTMIIDNSLIEKEALLRSTIAHECGHAIYHRSYYGRKKAQTAACTVSDISIQTDAHQLTTDLDWLEHHAKRFSAAILMPYPAVRRVCRRYADHLQLWYRNEPQLCNRLIVNRLASIFKVSCTTAQIRMHQLHLDFQETTETPSTAPPSPRNEITLISATENALARIETEHYDRLYCQHYG